MVHFLPFLPPEDQDEALHALAHVLELSPNCLERFMLSSGVTNFLTGLLLTPALTLKSHGRLLCILQIMLTTSSDSLSPAHILMIALSRTFNAYDPDDVNAIAPVVFDVIDMFIRKGPPIEFQAMVGYIFEYSAQHQEHRLFFLLTQICQSPPSFELLLGFFHNEGYSSQFGFLARFGLQLIHNQVESDTLFPLALLVSLTLYNDGNIIPDDAEDTKGGRNIFRFVLEFVRFTGLDGLLGFGGDKEFISVCSNPDICPHIRSAFPYMQRYLAIWWEAFASSNCDAQVKFLNSELLCSCLFEATDTSHVTVDHLKKAFSPMLGEFPHGLDAHALGRLEAFLTGFEEWGPDDLAEASHDLKHYIWKCD
jgi:hypothetical protein